MKLVALGTGNGFSTKHFQTNFLISLTTQNILIDAGTTLRYSLAAKKIKHTDIDAIFITHFHHDHVGGLAELLTKNYWNFTENGHSPHISKIYLRESQLDDLDKMLTPTFNNQGLTWRDYCDIQLVQDNKVVIENIIFTLIQTDDLHCIGMNSYALKISSDLQELLISGDIKNLEQSNLREQLSERTFAIIQDTTLIENPVHASLDDILAYYPKSYHSKLYAVHYEDNHQMLERQINILLDGQEMFFS